jgi:Rrf2 family protein
MNLSVKGEYALRAILDLTMHERGEPIRIADIARRQKIPQKFLELILSSLKQAGFVESRRGAEGGYLLAKDPETVTIGQVLRHTEGRRGAGRKRKEEDPFSDMWTRVDAKMAEILDHTSFADVAREWRERQGTWVPNWEI